MSYVKYCERRADVSGDRLFDALTSCGMVEEVADFQRAYDLDISILNHAVEEENAAYDYWLLCEEIDRQEEAWADHEYAIYAADLAACYPQEVYEDLGPGWRGRLAA